MNVGTIGAIAHGIAALTRRLQMTVVMPGAGRSWGAWRLGRRLSSAIAGVRRMLVATDHMWAIARVSNTSAFCLGTVAISASGARKGVYLLRSGCHSLSTNMVVEKVWAGGKRCRGRSLSQRDGGKRAFAGPFCRTWKLQLFASSTETVRDRAHLLGVV